MKTELHPLRAFAGLDPMRRGHVLVVDDEEQNRVLLRDTLEVHGYEIEEAANGAEAIEKIGQRNPDVLLLDVMMPRMDGFEVCRRLKSDAATAPIQILMVTALSERQERMTGIAAGANDFLNKPVDRQDLILRVRNAVQTRNFVRQLESERRKSEQLIRNLLPSAIAERVLAGETDITDSHPDVSVLVAGLVGFSDLSNLIGPTQMMLLLNEIYAVFDDLVKSCGLETIKSSITGYTVAGGLFGAAPNQTREVAHLAGMLHEAVTAFNKQYKTCLRLRIGISTGPVISGLVGRSKFSYDLWGDAVVIARQLEGTGRLGGTLVDEATYLRLKEVCRFTDPQCLQTVEPGPRVARELQEYLAEKRV